MARVQDIGQVVGSLKLSIILPLFTLGNLESSKYPGLLNRYVMNDPLITNASIRSLEKEMVEEEGRLQTLQRHGQVSDLPLTLLAAQRAATGGYTPTPASSGTVPPPKPPQPSVPQDMSKDKATPEYPLS